MSLNEFAIIEKYFRKSFTRDDVIQGSGDDCAVLSPPPDHQLLVTTDTLNLDRHFFADTAPFDIGYKSFAVSLSDIAAMGGEPRAILISLCLPKKIRMSFLSVFYKGLKDFSSRWSVDVVGGNLSSIPGPLVIDITVLGETRGRHLTRAGARIGDVLAVTGSLGKSAVGLVCLKKLGRNALKRFPNCVRAHLMPLPKIEEARLLVKHSGAHALIDISDGLSSDLHRLADASSVGVSINEHDLVIDGETRRAATFSGKSALDLAVHGGEEYELLVAIDPRSFDEIQGEFKLKGLQLYPIGRVSARRGKIKWVRSSGKIETLSPKGWDHFN
jgi:thiamine-monophosphate kinase